MRSSKWLIFVRPSAWKLYGMMGVAVFGALCTFVGLAFIGLRVGAWAIAMIVLFVLSCLIPTPRLVATRTAVRRYRPGGGWNPGGSRPVAFWKIHGDD